MVETVRVGEEGPSDPAFAIGCPVSCVVPSPGVGLVAAGLSPPATNSSPSTVTAAAPASAFGQVADDRRGAPGRVDGLDDADRRPGMRSGDGLAAERVDTPAQGGDRRVSHRNWQRGDGSVGPAVGGRLHRRVRPGSVKAAHDVRRGPDGGGLGIGAWHGQVADVGGGTAAGQRERLDRADTGRRSAPENQCPLSRHRHGRVVYRDGQRADPAHRAGGRAHGVNPVRRRVAGRQAANDDELARRSRLTTSRLSGPAMCQGSRPDSAAGRLGCAAFTCTDAVGWAVAPPWLAVPCVQAASKASTATTTTASVAAVARLPRASTTAQTLP